MLALEHSQLTVGAGGAGGGIGGEGAGGGIGGGGAEGGAFAVATPLVFLIQAWKEETRA